MLRLSVVAVCLAVVAVSGCAGPRRGGGGSRHAGRVSYSAPPPESAYQAGAHAELQVMVDSMRGRYRSEVIGNMGQPTSSRSDGRGGEVMTYDLSDDEVNAGVYFNVGPDNKVYGGGTIR